MTARGHIGYKKSVLAQLKINASAIVVLDKTEILKRKKNLCHHEGDFSLQAEYFFFEASHGKSLCDVIGGAVKRLLINENLQKCFKNPRNFEERVFNFCRENISNFFFTFLLKRNLQNERLNLKNRFS